MRFLFLLAMAFLGGGVQAQDPGAGIRSAARPLASLERLPDSVGQMFRPFRVIMVGEMHGTKEPAQFAGALAAALAKGGDSVLLGVEIPENQLGEYPWKHDEESLLASPFFQGVNGDGRNSTAWKDLILSAQRNPRIRLFFFDAPGAGRDSMMAQHILRQMEDFPGWKVVTLSGNIHNKTRAYNGQLRAGGYLLQAAGSPLSGRLCAVNTVWKEIAMWANMGDGLRLHTSASETLYARAAPADRYLLFLDPRSDYDYNAILFVKQVTAAEPVKR